MQIYNTFVAGGDKNISDARPYKNLTLQKMKTLNVEIIDY